MNKFLSTAAMALMLTGAFTSCKKSTSLDEANVVSLDEKSMINAAGFNSNWVEKTAD